MPSPDFRIDRIRVPAALLLALLQRTPAIRVAAAASECVLESPFGAVIRAAAASVAALGAVDSMAGATVYTLSTNHASPYTVEEGSQIAAAVYTLIPAPTAPPGSWTVSGEIPPGLQFGAPGNSITLPGIYNGNTPALFGTPTAPGSYTMVLQAWEYANGMGLNSGTFNYQVIVTTTVTPTPTPTPNPNAPAFTTQPMSATVTGGTVALDAVATNSPTYQWSLDGLPIAGATGPICLISNAASAAGSYTCVATNSSGTTTSNAAAVGLTITTDIGRLINISCRAGVGTGSNILISGFVVGGAGTAGSESLLIRASGPALVQFGVTGELPDPQLQLFSGSTVVGANNGWAGNAQIASTASSVGAFAWTDSLSHDSALLEKLPGGPYTAQIAGQSGDTGVALAEVYDATPAGTYTLATPRLVNISTRVQVGTGGGILIAGFVIGGATSRTVLIRASGPALVPFGVAGTLPDPQLQLYSPSTLVESDNGWGGSQQIASTAASVGAFTWGTSPTKDSALLVTLPPGAYTAQVSGASGDAGVALIEVYEVP
jgi:hypothetical protein